MMISFKHFKLGFYEIRKFQSLYFVVTALKIDIWKYYQFKLIDLLCNSCIKLACLRCKMT